MARLAADRAKREPAKRRRDTPTTHDAVQEKYDARTKDNSSDVQFVTELHKRLEGTGRLEKALTRAEMVRVMSAKRIPQPPYLSVNHYF